MSTTEGSELDHLAELSRVQDAFLTTIAVVDPDLPVPWCGRWRVRDLVVHLAGVHRWAAAQAAGRSETLPDRDTGDLQALYRDSAAELRATLHPLGPDTVVDTLLGPAPARVWHRRQLHETLVHLWDLSAAGGLPVEAAPELWADTVDEVVTVMHPRQVRLGRTGPLPRAIDLVATDAGRRWRLDGDEGAGAPAGVQVTGPASALALLLWRRTTPDDPALGVTGDPAVLTAALAQRLTP